MTECPLLRHTPDDLFNKIMHYNMIVFNIASNFVIILYNIAVLSWIYRWGTKALAVDCLPLNPPDTGCVTYRLWAHLFLCTSVHVTKLFHTPVLHQPQQQEEHIKVKSGLLCKVHLCLNAFQVPYNSFQTAAVVLLLKML